MSRTLWPLVVLGAAVIAGRAFDRLLRRRLGGRGASPWGEPEVSTFREGVGLFLLVFGVAVSVLLTRACPFPRIE